MLTEPMTLYKLMNLYLLKQVNFPLTNAQLTSFFTEHDYTTYFTLQQALNELEDAGLIHKEASHSSTRYDITKEGEETLNFFGKNISPAIINDMDEYLKEIAKTVHIPVLRKDFTIDEYQIYEAKLFGASAVLLICSLLDRKTLSKFLDLANELKLDALVEAHDEEEVHTALECGAKIIGVNNRNLKNFTVDVRNSLRLRALVPKDVVFVSESGIKTREDTRQLAAYHVNAVLIGETLMRSPDKKTALDLLRP